MYWTFFERFFGYVLVVFWPRFRLFWSILATAFALPKATQTTTQVAHTASSPNKMSTKCPKNVSCRVWRFLTFF